LAREKDWPQAQVSRRTCTMAAQRGQGLYQEFGGLAGSFAEASTSVDTRFRRLGPERAWTHCGWMPATEYERCPQIGQGVYAVAALSGKGLR
jgi:hypothetical protein